MSGKRLSIYLFVTLTASLLVAILVKDSYLWMDEVLSYLLLTDPSLAHANRALVSGMDANPPLFVNVYWLLAHGISADAYFLKGISVGLFALTLAWFYRYISDGQLVSRLSRRFVAVNFVLILVALSLTYLHYTLSTQLRTYSLYLLISWGYVVVLHQLIHEPHRRRRLLALAAVGTLFLFSHNVALFYIAGSGVFFGLLWLFTSDRRYVGVLAVHAGLALIWLLAWYPSFAVQALAGKPHSWIPLPTFLTTFETIGDLLPTLSSRLEKRYPALLLLRVSGVAALLLAVLVSRGRQWGWSVRRDRAFSLYLLSGFLAGFTLLLGLVISLTYTSVFLSRYFWPSSLLLIYQLLYAGWWLRDQAVARRSAWAGVVVQPLAGVFHRLKQQPVLSGLMLALFVGAIATFMVQQSRKIPLFNGEIRQDIALLPVNRPVVFESAYYFLPIWFHQPKRPVHYFFDWQAVMHPRNDLASTTDYKILEGVAQHYQPTGLTTLSAFKARQQGPFYVVDESSRYLIEKFVAGGQVRIRRVIPSHVPGHRILECSF